MQATINWIDNAKFEGISGSKHSVIMDGPPDHGGTNAGARPMEMMLLGLGGCTAFDVVNILRRSRQSIENCQAMLSAERAEGIPSPFTTIHVHFKISGKNINDAQVQRAIKLTAEKYCSASIMLEQAGVNITHDYEIIEI